MLHPTNPEHAAIIDKLAVLLAELPTGSTLSYAVASGAVGRDVAGRYRYLLQSAREKAEKQLGCLFEAVNSVGIKRLPPSEAPEVGLSAMRRVRRAAKRGVRRLARLSVNSLSDTEHKRVISYRAMLGAVAMISDGNKARTVAALVDIAKPIPPENILAMFTGPK